MKPHLGNSSSSSTLSAFFSYGLLTVLALFSVGPFIWLCLTALKGPTDNIFDVTQPLPSQWTLDNFSAVWKQVELGRYMLNSLWVAALTIGMNLVVSTLAAYPLSRMNFTGQGVITGLILSTMMIPFQVILIPLYLQVLSLGLTDYSTAGTLFGGFQPVNVYMGLLIPFAISGFGIFFMRQAMLNIPKDLEEAALLDGCNPWQTLWYVFVPLLKPSLATLAIFTLMASWGEFLWPSVVLNEEAHFTLPMGLVYLQGAFSSNWRLIAAGTLLSMLPMLILFLLFQRVFVGGTFAGAVKS